MSSSLEHAESLLVHYFRLALGEIEEREVAGIAAAIVSAAVQDVREDYEARILKLEEGLVASVKREQSITEILVGVNDTLHEAANKLYTQSLAIAGLTQDVERLEKILEGPDDETPPPGVQ